MPRLTYIGSRLWNSSIIWTWVLHGLRLGSGFLLLPLLLRLPKPEFGLYYVLVSLTSLVPLLDLGFLTSIHRAISYAMGGAKELQAHGVSPPVEKTGQPNFDMLWQLLATTRRLYAILALAVFVLVGAWGTYTIGLRVNETTQPGLTWLAWGITLVGATFEMYSGWWNVYLHGTNHVLLSTRIMVLAATIKYVLASSLLLAGAGLMSLPLATFVAASTQRWITRRKTLAFLSPHPAPPATREQIRSLLEVLWPNSWRVGIQTLSGYLTTNANTFLCMKYFGLGANGQYGLSLQAFAICQSMAMVWIAVKWPTVFQLRANHDSAGLQRLFWPRFWLFSLTYVVMASAAVWIGQALLHLLGTNKELLPQPWLTVLACVIFLEMQFSIWATLILTENRSPFLWPAVATNVGSLVITLALIHFSSLGIGALVLGSLIAGSVLNYWYWPLAGARSMKTTLLTFLTGRDIAFAARRTL